MFSPICFSNFSQFEQLKKKTNFLLVPNSFFPLCISWKKAWQIFENKIRRFGIIIYFTKSQHSEFEIGENIWWIHYLSLNSQKIWNALAQIFISLGKMVRYYFFYPLFAQEVLKSTKLPFAFLIHYGRIFQILSQNYKAFLIKNRLN